MDTKKEKEALGIKAIIYLQKMVMKKETAATARKGWRSMSEHEQDFTLRFAESMKNRNGKGKRK